MNNELMNDLLKVGIHAAEIMSSSKDTSLSFEQAMDYLFNQLKAHIEQLRAYIIDEKGENLQEEVICNNYCIRQGNDFVPLYQLPRQITDDMQITRINDGNAYYSLIPLCQGKRLIGLLELKTAKNMSNEVSDAISCLREPVSLGVNHIILVRNTIRDKELFDSTIEIAHNLQLISGIDELLSTFVKLTVKHMKFDRVTVFVFDDEGKNVIYHCCVNFNGERCFLKEIPEIPDLKDGLKPLQHLSGYWFPLRTNTRTIGAALFDNIYSSYHIPKRLTEILLPLCVQFASAIENIRLFNDIKDAAQTDKLTGLYNRAYFEEALKRIDVRSKLPISIVIGDLNGLKITNDVFGHFEGDQLLKSIAAVLKGSCRKADIIARWGGDEFIILLPQTQVKETDEICERIRGACLTYDKTKVSLSISLGHATKESDKEDIMQVLKSAEDRMYRHKLLESNSFRSSFVSSLKETLLEKCQETVGHTERMIDLSVKVGVGLGLADSELDELKLLAMLHDIGKVAIRDSVLNKPGWLDEEEWEEMKMHSEIGYRIAQSSPELSQIADYILCHHEKWDGSGYPLGKAGLEIPKLSRIISVIDAYDVMTHSRSYKNAVSHKAAVDELVRCAGTQFDPEIVGFFIQLKESELGDTVL